MYNPPSSSQPTTLVVGPQSPSPWSSRFHSTTGCTTSRDWAWNCLRHRHSRERLGDLDRHRTCMSMMTSRITRPQLQLAVLIVSTLGNILGATCGLQPCQCLAPAGYSACPNPSQEWQPRSIRPYFRSSVPQHCAVTVRCGLWPHQGLPFDRPLLEDSNAACSK
jgi:hypothetical protein